MNPKFNGLPVNGSKSSKLSVAAASIGAVLWLAGCNAPPPPPQAEQAPPEQTTIVEKERVVEHPNLTVDIDSHRDADQRQREEDDRRRREGH